MQVGSLKSIQAAERMRRDFMAEVRDFESSGRGLSVAAWLEASCLLSLVPVSLLVPGRESSLGTRGR